jgi:hypothetical protein
MNKSNNPDSANEINLEENSLNNIATSAFGDSDNIELISNHIERNVGKIDSVFHEIVSDFVHIDIHWVKPTIEFPFHTLVTSGMSDLQMNAPEGMEEYKFAELCVLLPESWKIDEISFKDENNYWPIRWLKTIARFPHEYKTWINEGHTIPNGDNAEPFAKNTKLGCILLLPSYMIGEKFFNLKISEEKTINFFYLCPIYKEEMEFKLKNGVNDLLDKFDKYDISEVINVSRKNTCMKKGLFGLW